MRAHHVNDGAPVLPGERDRIHGAVTAPQAITRDTTDALFGPVRNARSWGALHGAGVSVPAAQNQSTSQSVEGTTMAACGEPWSPGRAVCQLGYLARRRGSPRGRIGVAEGAALESMYVPDCQRDVCPRRHQMLPASQDRLAVGGCGTDCWASDPPNGARWSRGRGWLLLHPGPTPVPWRSVHHKTLPPGKDRWQRFPWREGGRISAPWS
jgi:hypothetical protein